MGDYLAVKHMRRQLFYDITASRNNRLGGNTNDRHSVLCSGYQSIDDAIKFNNLLRLINTALCWRLLPSG